MLTVKINLETALKVADLFVSTGFYKVWNNFNPPLTPERQHYDLTFCLKEESNDTIFTIHDDGRFEWRTIGNDTYYTGIDCTDNGGPFNEAQTATIKEFLIANGTPIQLKGMDLIYGIHS